MHYRLPQLLDESHRLPLETPLEPKSTQRQSQNNDQTFDPPASNPITKAPFPHLAPTFCGRGRGRAGRGRRWTCRGARRGQPRGSCTCGTSSSSAAPRRQPPYQHRRPPARYHHAGKGVSSLCDGKMRWCPGFKECESCCHSPWLRLVGG
jgi:hypothetical protein